MQRNNTKLVLVSLLWYRVSAVAYRGGGVWSVQTPPPRNSEGPTKNRAKLNPIVKTVKKKLLNLGYQHTKMFGKKAVKF